MIIYKVGLHCISAEEFWKVPASCFHSFVSDFTSPASLLIVQHRSLPWRLQYVILLPRRFSFQRSSEGHIRHGGQTPGSCQYDGLAGTKARQNHVRQGLQGGFTELARTGYCCVIIHQQ